MTPAIQPSSSRPHRSARPGYTLLEMLLVISLMMPFMLAATRVFVTTMRTIQSATAADTALSRYAAVERRLRDDTWRATAITATDQTIHLDRPSGPPVEYAFTPTGVERREGDAHSQWQLDSPPLRARADADGVTLLADDKPPAEIHLRSLVLWTKGVKP